MVFPVNYEETLNSESDAPLQESNHFPETIKQFKPISGGYAIKAFPPYKFFQFSLSENNHKLYVALGTITFLVKNGTINGLCIEIWPTTAFENEVEKLTTFLKDSEINFKCMEKQWIHVKQFTWATIFKVSKFKLNCDLILSGGGTGRLYHMSVQKQHV